MVQDGPEAEIKLYAAKTFDALSGDASLSRGVWDAALPMLGAILQVSCWGSIFWQNDAPSSQPALIPDACCMASDLALAHAGG